MTRQKGPASGLSSDDLYKLRRAVAIAQRARLKAGMAQQALRELVLEMEHRYGLLGRDMHLDVYTGRFRNGHREATDEPERDAHAGAPRPA